MNATEPTTPTAVPEGELPKWVQRERSRIATRHYRHVPWEHAPWANRYPYHCVHLSKSHVGLVAYTINADKGERDIQTPLKAGVYLRKYYGDILSPQEIAQWANLCVPIEWEVRECTDEAGIHHVYSHAPGAACMSKGLKHYPDSGCVHPLRVYADHPDIALAYIQNKEGRIGGRALIHRTRKIHSRLYGENHDLLKALLAKAGYSDGTLDGVPLPAILPGGVKVGKVGSPRKDLLIQPFVFPFTDSSRWARLDTQEGTLTLTQRASEATHSTHHIYGCCYPIQHSPSRSWGQELNVQKDWIQSYTYEKGHAPTEWPDGTPIPPSRTKVTQTPTFNYTTLQLHAAESAAT